MNRLNPQSMQASITCKLHSSDPVRVNATKTIQPVAVRMRTMHQPGRRSGFALVQAVGLILVTGLVLSLTGTILGFAFQANQNSMQSLRQHMVLRALESRLRSDCHRAAQVGLSDSGALELQIAQQRVSYALADTLVVRSSSLVDDRLPDEFSAKDEWLLPAKANMICQIQRSGTCPLITIEIDFDPESGWEPIQWKIRSGIHE